MRVVVRVVVMGTVDGVCYTFGDLVGSFVETVTERMVLAVFVVISHITLVLLGCVKGGSSRLFYSDLCFGWVAAVNEVNFTTLNRVAVVLGVEGFLAVAGGLFVVGGGVEAGVTLLSSETGSDGTSAFSELAFRDVYLGGRVVGGGAVDSIKRSVVGLVVHVKMTADVELRSLRVFVTGGLCFKIDALSSLLGLRLLEMPVLGLLEVMFFVDMNLLAMLGGTADSVVFVDANLFLVAGVAAVGRRRYGSSREGFGILFFVTFPSDL